MNANFMYSVDLYNFYGCYSMIIFLLSCIFSISPCSGILVLNIVTPVFILTPISNFK